MTKLCSHFVSLLASSVKPAKCCLVDLESFLERAHEFVIYCLLLLNRCKFLGKHHSVVTVSSTKEQICFAVLFREGGGLALLRCTDDEQRSNLKVS